VANASTFRAVFGDAFEINWQNAGKKSYSGIALVRSKGDHDIAMFRLSATASAEEYRSLAEAARELAKAADDCAVAAENAPSKAFKFDKAQLERIRDGLKSMDAKARVVFAATLGVKLADFGYGDDGKSITKAPTPPAQPDADKIIAQAMAGVGK